MPPRLCMPDDPSCHPPRPAVPKFALLASRGERLPVHGDGSATRSHLHVSDVAEAFDIILHKASLRSGGPLCSACWACCTACAGTCIAGSQPGPAGCLQCTAVL